MNRFKSFSGYCSYLKREHAIIVECADGNSKTTSGWLPIRFECDHEVECPYVSSCSIKEKLPKVLP